MLTAAHVLRSEDDRDLEEIDLILGHRDTGHTVWDGLVVWRDARDMVDLALVAMNSRSGEEPPRHGGIIFVSLADGDPDAIRGIGFPDFADYGEKDRQVEEIRGEFRRRSTAPYDLRPIYLKGGPDSRKIEGRPWAGVSGAAVFSADTAAILGVVIKDAPVTDGRLLMRPISALIASPEARQLLREYGVEANLKVGLPRRKVEPSTLDRLLNRDAGGSGEEGVRVNAAALAGDVYAREKRNQAIATYVTQLGDSQADIGFHEVDGGQRRGRLSTVRSFYQDMRPRRLVVLGPAGSGKTVLITALIVQLTEPGSTPTPQNPVPVRINLANWNDVDRPGGMFVDFLISQLHIEYGQSEERARSLVDAGLILPVLDGLDEMDRRANTTHGGENRRVKDAVEKINAYLRERRPERPLVITSRETFGMTVFGATVVHTDVLDRQQIVEYVQQRFASLPDTSAAWDPVLRALSGGAGSGAFAERVLRSPWRLMLALVASAQGLFRPDALLAEMSLERHVDQLTQVQNQLVAQFVPATFERTKAGARVTTREGGDSGRAAPTFTVPTAEDLETWLGELARFLDRFGNKPISKKETISATDINLYTMWPVAGHRLVRTVHTVVHLLCATFFIGACAFAISRDDPGTQNVRWPALGIASVLLCLWAMWLGCTRNPRRSRTKYFQVRSLKARQLSPLERVVAGVEIFLAIGGSLALVGYLVGGPVAAVGTGVLLGGSIAAVMDRVRLDRGLTGGFDPLLAWRNEVGLGLALGAAGALVFPLVLDYPAPGGASFGFTLGFAGAFVLSLQAWLRYTIAMSIMKIRHRLPWRLGAFLHWARAAGLFRISGTGYQYRHGELQEWLARPR